MNMAEWGFVKIVKYLEGWHRAEEGEGGERVYDWKIQEGEKMKRDSGKRHGEGRQAPGRERSGVKDAREWYLG